MYLEFQTKSEHGIMNTLIANSGKDCEIADNFPFH